MWRSFRRMRFGRRTRQGVGSPRGLFHRCTGSNRKVNVRETGQESTYGTGCQFRKTSRASNLGLLTTVAAKSVLGVSQKPKVC